MGIVSQPYTDVMRERAEFEDQMKAHLARLCEYAGRYVKALTPEDRTEFLDAALAAAWRARTEFRPERESLYQWWEKCLQTAARTRESWYVFNIHGRRVAVRADRLGRGG